MKGICMNFLDLDLIFDSFRDVAMATDFGQNLQSDHHSAPWHFKTELNIAVWISRWIVKWSLYIVYKYGELWSSNARDWAVRNLYFWNDTAKFGLSHRISQQLLNQRFSYGRGMHSDYKTDTRFAVVHGNQLLLLRLGWNWTIFVHYILPFWNGLEYHNFDFSTLIGNHFCTTCKNLVRFGLVIPEF